MKKVDAKTAGEMMLNARIEATVTKKFNDMDKGLGIRVRTLVREEMETLKKEAADLSRMTKLLILKHSILTEISWYTRHTKSHNAIVSVIASAFDEDADWWFSREHLPMSGWVEQLQKYAETVKQRRAAEDTLTQLNRRAGNE